MTKEERTLINITETTIKIMLVATTIIHLSFIGLTVTMGYFIFKVYGISKRINGKLNIEKCI